jgi:hypothetical protein
MRSILCRFLKPPVLALLFLSACTVSTAQAATFRFTGTGTQTTTTLGGELIAKKDYAVIVQIKPSLDKPKTIAFSAALKGKKAIIATASNTVTLVPTGTSAKVNENPIVFGPATGRYSHSVDGANRIFTIDLHQNNPALQYSDHLDITIHNGNFITVKRHIQSGAMTIVYDLKFKGKLR